MSPNRDGTTSVIEVTDYFAGGAKKRKEMLAQPEHCDCGCDNCECGTGTGGTPEYSLTHQDADIGSTKTMNGG